MNNIRVAFISDSRATRLHVENGLSMMGIEIAGNPMGGFNARYKKMIRERPDIIFVLNDFPKNPRDRHGLYRFADRVRRDLGNTRILVRTSYPKDHQIIQEAGKEGIHVIDERVDFNKMAKAITQVKETQEGQPPVMFYEVAASHELETYRQRWEDIQRRGKEVVF